MQSIAPGLLIESQVIDAFASVLNHEERKNKVGKMKTGYYFPTDAVLPEILKK